MDASAEPGEEAHAVADLTILLEHADDVEETETLSVDEARQRRLDEIEAMRQMAELVNRTFGGDG